MKMKQTMKRLLACTLAVMTLLTLPVTTKAQAEVKDNLPEKVRYYTSGEGGAGILTLSDTKQTIENVKSSSSYLKAELLRRNTDIRDGVVYRNDLTIGLYPLKDGKYAVTYDIVKNNQVVSNLKMEVYAYPSPVKSVTLDGKTESFYGTKTKAKIKVSLDKGNTIKKLEIGTYQIKTDTITGRKQSELTYKTFKNGATVQLGTKSDYYEFVNNDRLKDDYFNGSLRSSLNSRTYIRITYKDKYTGQEETITKTFYGQAK